MIRGLFAFLVFAAITPPCAIVAVLLALVRRGEADLTVARAWGRGMLAAVGARLSVRGREHLRGEAPCIYASNHASNVDIWALLQALPLNTKFVAKVELFRVPFIAWYMRRAGFIAIDRKDRTRAIQSLRGAAERIRGGRPVVVFPEGTRSPDGRLQPFKKGPFHLALQAGVPVVPVALRGTRAVLPRGVWQVTPGPIEVRFLPAIDVAAFGDDLAGLQAVVHRRIAAALEDDTSDVGAAPGAAASAR